MSRRRGRVRRFVRALVWGVALGTGAGMGAWLHGAGLPVARAAVRAEPFRLRVIDWVGLRTLPPGDLTRTLAVAPGSALVDLDPDRLAARLEALPRVERCTAIRVPPDRLVVRVSERVPIGRVAETRLVFDPAGERFPGTDEEIGALPPVEGESALAVPLLRAARAAGREVAAIEVRGAGDLLLRLRGGATRIRAGADPARVMADLGRLERAGALRRFEPAEVDLRFVGAAVLRSTVPGNQGG